MIIIWFTIRLTNNEYKVYNVVDDKYKGVFV